MQQLLQHDIKADYIEQIKAAYKKRFNVAVDTVQRCSWGQTDRSFDQINETWVQKDQKEPFHKIKGETVVFQASNNKAVALLLLHLC